MAGSERPRPQGVGDPRGRGMEKKKSGFCFAWFLLFFCPGFLFRPASPRLALFLSESFFLRRKKDGKKGLRVSEK